MLARQITEDLQNIRCTIRPGETKNLFLKAFTSESSRSRARALGTPPKCKVCRGLVCSALSQIIRQAWSFARGVRPQTSSPFANFPITPSTNITACNRPSASELTRTPDGDGVKNELTRGDITAVSVFQAALQVPGRVIPRDPEIEQAVLNGEKVFDRIGCASCHIPRLPLDRKGWIYSEPNPYNPAGNLRVGEAKTLYVDLSSDELPAPRLKPDPSGIVWVEAYTDFKLHDICEPEDAEPLDMNQSVWSKKFKEGNRKFLTKRLWGVANEPAHFHHGMFTTTRRAVLAHSGEALQSRRAFQSLPKYDQDSLIEFLKTLQVLPPGTKGRIVDEKFQAREWPLRGER